MSRRIIAAAFTVVLAALMMPSIQALKITEMILTRHGPC